jgi:hypothetical protein
MFIQQIVNAIQRAKLPIISVMIIYIVFLVIGILMVHFGNTFALSYRDNLVNQAHQSDPSSIALEMNEPVKAAIFDFSGNLFLGAIPKTIAGIGVIFAYPFVAFQGWVGGIVSVRWDHTSRFDDIRSTTYFISTIILQLLPYSLTVGSGINLGLSMFRQIPEYQGKKWLNLFPKEAVLDIFRIYIVSIPIFFVASLWEFLSPWNI